MINNIIKIMKATLYSQTMGGAKFIDILKTNRLNNVKNGNKKQRVKKKGHTKRQPH